MNSFYKSRSLKFGITLMLILCVCTAVTSVLTVSVSNLILNSSQLAQDTEEFIAEIDAYWFNFQSKADQFKHDSISLSEFETRINSINQELVDSAKENKVGLSKVAPIIVLTKRLSKENIDSVVSSVGAEVSKQRKLETDLYKDAINSWSERANFLNWSIIGLQVLTLILVAAAVSQHLNYLDERKKAMEANAKLAKLVETSQECIMSVDSQGKIVSWNPASENTFGLDDKSSQSVNIKEFASSEESKNKIETCIASKSFVSDEEIEFKKSDKSTFIASVSASPVIGEGGEILSITLIAKDVTEQAVFRYEQADFIASLTHDLKNPLIANNQVLKLLAQGEIDSSKQSSVLGKVVVSNNEMIEVFSSMLELYKINAGVFKSQPMAVDVSRLVNKLIEAHSQQAGSKSIELFSTVSNPKSMYFTDPLLVQKVVGNLIDNAIKYSESDTAVEVVLAEEEEFLSIKVKDEGKGISESQKDSLFSFSKARGAEKSPESSSVGLYLCHKLALELGGKINYEARNPKGSVFELSIPCRRSIDKVALEGSTPESECSSTSA